MKRIAALAAIALAGCTDTLIGPFIEPTHELASIGELEKLGVSLAPGSADSPRAICASSYDREFAPWGEHYRLESWLPFAAPQAFLDSGFNAEAIIDVDTGKHDFGEVALIWKADGTRLKVFIQEQPDGAPHLPGGCNMFRGP